MGKLLETVDLVTNFYTYEGVVKALNKVSLVVDHGSTFGLVGESGCGKSVTVRSIMRIIQEPGRIEGGKVIVYLDEKNRRHGHLAHARRSFPSGRTSAQAVRGKNLPAPGYDSGSTGVAGRRRR